LGNWVIPIELKYQALHRNYLRPWLDSYCENAKGVDVMKVTCKFSNENNIQNLILELLKSRIDTLIEQSYDNKQANTATSQKQDSKGGECA